jgi:hypothetical protein
MLTPSALPTGDHSPNVLHQRRVTGPTKSPTFDAVGPPQLTQDGVCCRPVQSRFDPDKFIVTVFRAVFVELYRAKYVLYILGSRHPFGIGHGVTCATDTIRWITLSVSSELFTEYR